MDKNDKAALAGSEDMPIGFKVNGAGHTLKHRPNDQYEPLTLGEYLAAVKNPRTSPVAKDADNESHSAAKATQTALVPSAYRGHDARNGRAQEKNNGKYLALVLDVDGSDIDPLEAVRAILGNVFVVTHNTYSDNQPGKGRRERLVIPLTTPLSAFGYPAFITALNERFTQAGCVMDPSARNKTQLAYFGMLGPWAESPRVRINEGPLLDLRQCPDLIAQAEKIRIATPVTDGDKYGSPRWTANLQLDSETILLHFGCAQATHDRLTFPGQTGQAGLQLFDDGGWSAWSETAERYLSRKHGDALDLLCVYGRLTDHQITDIAKATIYGYRIPPVQYWQDHGAAIHKEATGYWQAMAEHGRRVWNEELELIDGRRIISRGPDGIVLESPTEHIRLTGLAERFADIVYEAGERDTRVFATAAGLLGVSALAAPFYALQTHEDELVSLHLYGLILGPTASGKEAIRALVRMALEAAGRGGEYLDGIASMPALHEHLAEPDEGQAPGAVTLAMDEQGINLKIINSSSMGHQQQLMKGLMSLFGLGFQTLSKHKVRDKSGIIPAVRMPRTNLLWTSTPGKFLDAISAADSESGQLNRFLTFWVPSMPPKRKQRAKRSLLQGLLPNNIEFQCAKFQYVPQEQYHPGRAPDRIIKTTPDALALMDAFDDYVENEHIIGKPELHADSWGRAREYLKKVAGVLAVSDDSANPECRAEHVRLAEIIVKAAVGGIADLADRSSTKNVKPSNWEKVLTFIDKNKDADGWVPAREIMKGPLRYEKDPKKILQAMIDAGELEDDHQGLTKKKWIVRRAPEE